jgi:hypothetical protein
MDRALDAWPDRWTRSRSDCHDGEVGASLSVFVGSVVDAHSLAAFGGVRSIRQQPCDDGVRGFE